MSAVGTPFEPVVRIYPGGNPVDQENWPAGVDITTSVRRPGSQGGQPITYSGGRPDEAASADAGKMNLTLDDAAGDFSTANPNGRFYGLLRRGTPITLAVRSGVDDFSRTVAGGLGTSSGGASWASAAIWSTDGTSAQAAFPAANAATAPRLADANMRDFDAYMTVWPTVAATGSDLVYGLMARADSTGAELLIFAVCFNTGGAVQAKIFRIYSGGLVVLSSVTLAATYVANDKFRVHAQGVGEDLRLRVWKPADPDNPEDDEPDTWSTTTTDTVLADARIYSTSGLYFWRTNGNTNPGTVNFKVADLSYEAIEFTGSVISWPVRWDKSGRDCWAPIQAAGILRRIRQNSTALRSPLYRQLSGYSPIGYWPLEDESGATRFASSVPYVGAARGSDVNAAQDSTLAGASVAPVFTAAAGRIRATTSRRQTGTGFAALFLAKLAGTPGSDTTLATYTAAGLITRWELRLESSGTVIRVRGYEADGTLTVNSTTGVGGVTSWNSWVAWQLEAERSGGTVSWAMNYHAVGDTATYTVNSTYASSVTPRVYGVDLGGSDCNGAAWSHLWIGENTLPFVDATFYAVSDGYRGELAADRIERLCLEGNVPCVIDSAAIPSAADDSAAMGPQRPGSLLNAIEEAAAADYGILYEYGNGLRYRPLTARYEQPVDLELSVPAGEIDQPPDPADDDQKVRNDWTVARYDGSSARVFDQEHIDAEGLWDDTATINVETDDVLPDQAGWRTYLGTRPDPRWPQITINFARSPHLLPAWRIAPFAPRIQVTTGLDQVAGSDPDVIAEGFEATLWPDGWTIAFNCSPAGPYDIPLMDDSGWVLDSETSALDAGIDDNDTAIVVDYGDDPYSAWHDGDEPMAIEIGGEVMTLTAVSALFSTSKQTLTVTRSVNGIVKSHAAGALVRLAEPVYLAL
ncbi:hypothetical protein [Actinoplanes sp. NPDC049118]|uniref:hypothetical protein n=1 Tax=Actinoplanes sp. NPDC049118 TaxID=3155769 RepID=UPI0033DC70AF